MEKYFVMYTSNGELAISEIKEYGNLNSAVAKYHNYLSLLWADASTQTASVVILDVQMNIVGNYRESVKKA